MIPFEYLIPLLGGVLILFFSNQIIDFTKSNFIFEKISPKVLGLILIGFSVIMFIKDFYKL